MRQIKIIFFLLLTCVCLSSCGKKKATDAENKGYLYYVMTEGTSIERQEYTLKATEQTAQISELLAALSKTPKSIDLKAAISNDIKVQRFEVKDEQLEIHFSKEYEKLKKSSEILLRAAVVKTLVQVPGVQYVSFFIEEEALTDSQNIPVGLMSDESFVQSSGSDLESYQTADLLLYFPGKDGITLCKESRLQVHYSVNTSIEKLVVEQLMKGPKIKDAQKMVPDDATLVGVSVKEGVCYVTFTKEFLKASYNQSPEATIYSIVNSIIANGNVIKVQILVEGNPDAVYLNSIKLNQTFEWNADIIKEAKE